MKRVGERRERSDKKKDIKPTIALELKDAIFRLSYLTHIPVKDVAQQLSMLVIQDKKAIEHISPYFKRDLLFGKTVFIGNIQNESIKQRKNEKGERITIRYTQEEYKKIALLSYTLDCTPSYTCAILLDISMRNIRFVNAFIKQYLQHELNDYQMRELKQILRYVSTVGESHHSWASLLAYVVEEIGSPVAKIKEMVNDFIEAWRD